MELRNHLFGVPTLYLYGKGHTNLTRTGLRAGTSEASDRVEYEETQRLHVSDPR